MERQTKRWTTSLTGRESSRREKQRQKETLARGRNPYRKRKTVKESQKEYDRDRD